MKYRSNLERVLSEGKFVVTAEIGPPKGSDPKKIEQKGKILRGYANAFNITDNQTAVVRMSSIAGCYILLKMGLEPIMQMNCRDRNRIALQSDVLGASANGVKNIFCITGDHQSFGNHPASKGVYDVDSVQLIQIIKNMRDNGVFESGDTILSGNPDVFIGAAANPFSDPCEFRVDRLEKKVEAGAEFIQTQSVFNLDKFNMWVDEVRSRGLDKTIRILAGVTPLKSLKMTERMKFYIPGVDVPDKIYNRMKNAVDPKKEGYKIAVETIRELKNVKGIHGIHLTAIFWEDIIPSLVKETGLYPG
ncbi:5,10-methylenetetrahydrofolate reductase (ferredoxin) [Thermoplasmatales archaeon SCGC AB-539-N05]|nr:5,10-methylenetetrahydrofolate reductase (ferredoxin) [Thermoplasmatales archaeon SCGC AB-539-N05]